MRSDQVQLSETWDGGGVQSFGHGGSWMFARRFFGAATCCNWSLRQLDENFFGLKKNRHNCRTTLTAYRTFDDVWMVFCCARLVKASEHGWSSTSNMSNVPPVGRFFWGEQQLPHFGSKSEYDGRSGPWPLAPFHPADLFDLIWSQRSMKLVDLKHFETAMNMVWSPLSGCML